MPQVSRCLRRLLIIFNIFFVVAGGLTIIVSSVGLSPSQDDSHEGNDVRQKHQPTPETHMSLFHSTNQPINTVIQSECETTSHIVLYIVGSVTMVIAFLGACGAHKRNLVALTVYLVCMVIGSLLMLRVGVPAAVARPELESLVEERWRSCVPLDQTSVDIKNQAEALQKSLHCCGVFSYEDWGENIPDSCLCNLEEEMEGSCQTVNYRNFLFNLFWQKKSIFKQHCFPLIVDAVKTNANITLGVVFTLFVLVLLGFVLSSLMICQMFNTLPSVPVMFSNQPPAYQQLYNLPE